MTSQERIDKALEIAASGMNDGAHHKMWTIDQMVRALTGCPIIKRQGISSVNGSFFTYDMMIENDEYIEWLRNCQDGDNGPLTYEWDTGIAP